MKHLFLLTLLIFVGTSSIAYCAQTTSDKGTLGSKINLIQPGTAAARANKNGSISSPYSEIMNDPIINSTLNGFGNMMQGMSGGSYSAQERTKQQMDYAQQQSKYSEGDED